MNRMKIAALAAGLTILLFAVSVSAAPTVCVPHPKGTPAATTAIAVASNFFEPAKEMLDFWQPNNTLVWLCHNSTVHLINEINDGIDLPLGPSGPFPDGDPGKPRYGMFFAADDKADQFEIHFDYALGIPVVFGFITTPTDRDPLLPPVVNFVTKVNDLITGTATPHADAATIEESGKIDMAPYSISPIAVYTALADPTVAPYGAAAEDILTDMGYLYPPPQAFPQLFANIALTFETVGTDATPTGSHAALSVRSGFVSEAQICRYIKEPGTFGSVAYVEFINDEYTLLQTAALLPAPDLDPDPHPVPDPDPVAQGLYDNIQDAMEIGDWADFLYRNCYLNP